MRSAIRNRTKHLILSFILSKLCVFSALLDQYSNPTFTLSDAIPKSTGEDKYRAVRNSLYYFGIVDVPKSSLCFLRILTFFYGALTFVWAPVPLLFLAPTHKPGPIHTHCHRYTLSKDRPSRGFLKYKFTFPKADGIPEGGGSSLTASVQQAKTLFLKRARWGGGLTRGQGFSEPIFSSQQPAAPSPSPRGGAGTSREALYSAPST